MIKSEVEKEYFDWLYYKVCEENYSDEISFVKLFKYLHNVEFFYILPKDENRAEDGVELRELFSYENDFGDISDILNKPCSVLEMMIALAIRCEDIMGDPRRGDRTKQWFWMMIGNLGLNGMYDKKFIPNKVDNIIYTFLNREYECDGKGGLFRITNIKYDLRKFEIWVQMLWFLNTMK